MSVHDIIKSSFLKQFNSDLSTSRIMMMLGIVAVLGIYIFFVYRVTCRKQFYNSAFAISLVVISMTTSIIILTVQSSVVISLGMVGALSIVRFRTAIKDPMDLAYLFWAISVGIICGANLYEIAIEGSFVITIVMLILHMIPNVKPTMLLIVHSSDLEVEGKVKECAKPYATNMKVRSRNISVNGVDLVIEVKTKQQVELIRSIAAIEKVDQATLMSHDGEVTC